MSGPLGVGFVGTGMISDTYLQNLTSFPDVNVVALGDLDEARAARQAAKYGIKHILSGHNYVSESVLPQSWGYNAGDATHLKAHRTAASLLKKGLFPAVSGGLRAG